MECKDSVIRIRIDGNSRFDTRFIIRNFKSRRRIIIDFIGAIGAAVAIIQPVIVIESIEAIVIAII